MNTLMPTSAHKINRNKYSKYSNGSTHYPTLNGCPELPIALDSYQQHREDIDIFSLANMTE